MLPTRTLPGGRLTASALAKGPNGLPLCRWCDFEILAKRRRTFCSDYCVHQWRLRTDPGYLRDQVLARDRGICAVCSRRSPLATFTPIVELSDSGVEAIVYCGSSPSPRA